MILCSPAFQHWVFSLGCIPYGGFAGFRSPLACQTCPLAMGALSEDQLFISPFMSLIVVLLVMLLMQVGSNYFARMQQVPLHS